MPNRDLTAEAFLALRQQFFDDQRKPIQFSLREKKNTQDDPFDEYVATIFKKRLSTDVTVAKAPGPLITPDMVLFRPAQATGKTPGQLIDALSVLVGIEVKKLERGDNGAVARASGLDYNSTPPCGTIRTYDAAGQALDIRGYYLFVCMESVSTNSFRLTSLALVDGNLLNEDFEYYLSVTGKRSKSIGLGTYGDGANRQRPMLIFANPLGSKELDRHVTLISSSANLAAEYSDLTFVGTISRTTAPSPITDTQTTNKFFCYRYAKDNPTVFDITNPFPTPKNRSAETTSRGRFELPITLPR